jgi:hypothetical protein
MPAVRRGFCAASANQQCAMNSLDHRMNASLFWLRCTMTRATIVAERLRHACRINLIGTVMTTYPAYAPAGQGAEFLNIVAQLGNVYSHSFQSTARDMWMSSFHIVQDHAARAFANASQECLAALARNAVDIQQRSLADLVGANQQAFALMGSAFTKAVAAGAAPQNFAWAGARP